MSLFSVNFLIEKGIEISAPKKQVWDYIVNHDKKSLWSPWLLLDKDCFHEAQGRVASIGYIELWDGKIIGKGKQIVKEIKKDEYISSDLFFEKPFKSENKVAFHLSESKGKTKIIWKMNGSLPFFMVFFKKQMQGYIKSDFDRGLHMLKHLIEKGNIPSDTAYIGETQVNKKYFINISGQGTISEISTKMLQDFQKLRDIAIQEKIEGFNYFSIYDKADPINDSFEYRACLEISQDDYGKCLIDSNFEPDVSTLESGSYFKTSHEGNYRFLGNAWTGAFMYTKAHNISVSKKRVSLEVYEKGPLNEKNEDHYITNIYLPIT